MALGRYTSDLEPGDILGPIEYRTSPFVVREYSHSVEIYHEFFQDAADQLVNPMLIHLDKLRLYNRYCPEGAGPHARVHYEFDARFHDVVKVDEPLTVQGVVSERYMKRGREYVKLDMELRSAADGRLLISYTDTVLLSYEKETGHG